MTYRSGIILASVLVERNKTEKGGPPARSNVMVVAYAAFAGICFFIQGIFYLRAGIAAPFFWPGDEQRHLKILDRALHGLICIAIAGGLLSVVTITMWNRRAGIRGGDVVMALLLGGPGIAFMMIPETALRWTGRSHTISHQTLRRLAGARVVGGLLLLAGLLFLTI
jgi:predicted membrane channel-forming protein YqfA (hemolysin III family)